MKIDYSKSEFTQDERRYMFSEAQRLHETNPNHIPVLISLIQMYLRWRNKNF
jgi:hypothetical protein